MVLVMFPSQDLLCFATDGEMELGREGEGEAPVTCKKYMALPQLKLSITHTMNAMHYFRKKKKKNRESDI